MDRNVLESNIRSRMSDERFSHTCSVAEMAVSLAECYGVDTELAWETAMLHDIAKELTTEQMEEIAREYGHEIGELSLKIPDNLHAEIGALIAEHEYGLKDTDAINAIRYHVCARPGMSMLEKIIYFSDFAEPSRPNYAIMQYLYRIAKHDINEAMVRGLRYLLEYQIINEVDPLMCELCTNAFDFLLDERINQKVNDEHKKISNPELLTDKEFDMAFGVIKQNGIRIKSVENIRFLGGFTTTEGKQVRTGKIIRSGDLSRLTDKDAKYLVDELGLTLVIDMRAMSEVDKDPDVQIPGVRNINIPMTESIDKGRMNQLTKQYQNGESADERAWYVSQYAGIDEVRKMYMDISVDPESRDAIREIFRLMIANEGTVLFHCTSGKDRTGILAALFLYALGCSQEDVINDYNASAISFMAMAESFRIELIEHGYSVELQRGIQTILSVVPEAIASGLYYLNTRFMTPESLIVDRIGLREEEYKELRDKFLV